jgi:hypothetical protein
MQTDLAHAYAEENHLQARYADVPPPDDAVNVGAWEECSDGRVLRFFRGTQRGTVSIAGLQNTLGSVERRWIYDAGDGGYCIEVDAATARGKAGDWLAAADELESLAD